MNLPRYIGIFCLATLAVIVALWALFLLGVQVPGSGLSVLPVLCAALYEGQAYAKTHNAAPEKSAAWRFAGQKAQAKAFP